MRVRLWGPVLVGLALLAACGGAPRATTGASSATAGAPSATAPALTPERERLLRDLIARANQEGSVEAEVPDTAMPAAGTLRDAFVNRFAPLGLNISVNIGAGQQPQIWANVQTTLAAGGTPQYDALVG